MEKTIPPPKPPDPRLLMFGNEYDIVREFNAYFLDYQEQYDADTRWTDRIISSSGDWSGNVYDFYFRVYNKLIQDIKVPFKMEGGTRVDDTDVHKALREALANCLVHADYYGRQGLVIVKKRNSITMSNPGSFRIEMIVICFYFFSNIIRKVNCPTIFTLNEKNCRWIVKNTFCKRFIIAFTSWFFEIVFYLEVTDQGSTNS